MNSFYRQMNALLFCAAVVATIPAYSMENEVLQSYNQEVFSVRNSVFPVQCYLT